MRALLLALFLPTAAIADCINETEVFSCQIGNKTLEICHWKGALIYSFGPANAPDLTIAEPLETVAFTPWPGVGSAIWENVAFHNQGYTYEVWTAVERNPEDTRPLQGGVNVLKGEELQAQLTCDNGTASQSLDAIYELKTAIGQCWDFDQDRWITGCN
jgi:hypothetical protein